MTKKTRNILCFVVSLSIVATLITTRIMGHEVMSETILICIFVPVAIIGFVAYVMRGYLITRSPREVAIWEKEELTEEEERKMISAWKEYCRRENEKRKRRLKIGRTIFLVFVAYMLVVVMILFVSMVRHFPHVGIPVSVLVCVGVYLLVREYRKGKSQ